MVANRSHVSDGLYMTVEQYLALDESSDAKYEYLDGYVFLLRPPSSAYDDDAIIDMAGGSVAHAALCARMASLLDQVLAASPCTVYTSDARMKLAEKRYLYRSGDLVELKSLGVSFPFDEVDRRIRL